MIDFDTLLGLAADLHGGLDAVLANLPQPASGDMLRALPDARYLAAMSRCVFAAGFSDTVVAARWSAIEQRFARFDPATTGGWTDADIDRVCADRAVIRHRPKLEAVRANARFVLGIAAAHGSFGAFLAEWPDDDIVGLWQTLRRDGCRLGGRSGPAFLAAVGRDTFEPTDAVNAVLKSVGIVDGNPATLRNQRRAQAAFSTWRRECDRPYCQIGRIVGLAAGAPIPTATTGAACSS